MTEVANEHSYETWGEMMYDTHEHTQVEYTAKAMEIAAIRFREWCDSGGEFTADNTAQASHTNEELFYIWNNEKY